jgi:small-conductance mechanosensitive channel
MGARQKRKKGVTSWVRQGLDRAKETLLKKRGPPPMEMNQTAKEYQAAEKELLKLIEAVEEIEEGDLKAVEETIYQGIFQIGRKLMEGRLNTEKKSGASSS